MKSRSDLPVIGLVPAAGRGSRLAPLPCSKEILPVGTHASSDGPARPKAVIQYLLEAFQTATIERAVVILGADKWDVAKYLTLWRPAAVDVVYAGIEASPGTPFSLDAAYPWVRDARCALGFPDILLPVRDPYRPLLRCLDELDADVVLGLLPTDDPASVDVVEVDAAGRVVGLVPKPAGVPAPASTWSVAVWNPSFTRFMHELLAPAWREGAGRSALLADSAHGELFVGDVINHARGSGMRVHAVLLADQPGLDIGTPENFSRAPAFAAARPGHSHRSG